MPSQYFRELGPLKAEVLSQTRESAHPHEAEQLSLTDLLAQSAAECGLQEKETAGTLGYDARYWSRIKSGEKKAHLDPIAELPDKVQRLFLTRWAKQLKMTVSEDDTKKRALADLARACVTALAEIA